MIRIEGIPIVTARLVDAQRTSLAKTRNQRRKTSKIGTGVKAPLAIQGKMKAA